MAEFVALQKKGRTVKVHPARVPKLLTLGWKPKPKPRPKPTPKPAIPMYAPTEKSDQDGT